MSDAVTNRAGMGLETGEEGGRGGKKIWRAPRIACLDGRSALAPTGVGGPHTDTTITEAPTTS